MKIAVLGFGTVGKGVYETAASADGIEVARIMSRHTVEGYEYLSDIITSDISDICDDPEIELAVECIGGVHPAKEYVLECMRAGKHIVTTNKNLVSACYRELRETAESEGVRIRFTGAAGGGIPWLYNLMRTRRCDEILRISGIINGTCNFILDRMYENSSEFDDALLLAQEKGYAEADPSSDIEGTDTLRKAVISSILAFDAEVTEDDVLCYGIDTIEAKDIKFLKSIGRVPKMMMNAELKGRELTIYAEPAAVGKDAIEASVRLNYNLITLHARNLGVQSYYGEGAGMMPTGASVIQDVIDIRDDVVLRPASGHGDSKCRFKVNNEVEVHAYYLRCEAMTDEIEKIAESAEEQEGSYYCITKPVSVLCMHDIARRAKAEGRSMFMAALV